MATYTDLKKRYPDDPALKYAIGVLQGKIIAGVKIKQACERHINDLRRIENDSDFIYVYDQAESEKIVKKNLLEIRIRLESIQDDVTHLSELAGEYVKDAIAKIEIALRHLDD